MAICTKLQLLVSPAARNSVSSISRLTNQQISGNWKIYIRYVYIRAVCVQARLRVGYACHFSNGGCSEPEVSATISGNDRFPASSTWSLGPWFYRCLFTPVPSKQIKTKKK